MPALNDPRRETFARGLFEDLSSLAAYQRSGFKAGAKDPLTIAKRMATRNDIVGRLDELRRDMDWGATADIAKVINELAWLARRARTMDTPAALVAAKGILAEVAKLKGQLGDAGLADATPPEPPMSRKEWLATYAPAK